MRMKRLFGTATATAVLLAGPLSAAAQAQEAVEAQTGVGSGIVRSTLLGVDIGNLLNLDLLDDESLSTIDPVNGVPLSEAVFNPLKLSSSVLGDLSLAGVATRSTGAEDTKSVTQNPIDGNIPLPIVSGLLNGTLSSVVDADGARSSLLAGVGDLSLVGGLLGMGEAPEALTFTTNAAPATAEGVRGLDIPSLDLLNLGNLLAGIGLPLEDLPLTDLVGLLDGLGIDSVVVGGDELPTGDLIATVESLVGSLDVLDDVAPTDVLDSGLCGTVDGILDDAPLVGGIGGILPPGTGDVDCTSLPTTGLPVVGDLLTSVTELLEPILGGVLPVLDGLNLLEVSDVQAGMVAKATDSVDTSVADVVASIGSLKVANLDILNDLDLTDDLNVLSGVGDTVSNLLNEGLNLPGLLDVDILKITELVEPDGDYTKALSSLSALSVNVNPLVGALQAGSDEPTAASILGDGLPLLGGDMDLLGGLLGGVTSVLSDGVGIEVATMASEGFFTPVAALPPTAVPPAQQQPVTTPDGKLPRTGANTALPALMAVLLAGAALGMRRVIRTEKLNG